MSKLNLCHAPFSAENRYKTCSSILDSNLVVNNVVLIPPCESTQFETAAAVQNYRIHYVNHTKCCHSLLINTRPVK